MSVQGLVFLVNKKTHHISYAGPVPKVYGQITGLSDVDYSTLRDLSIFGAEYVGLGFLTKADAIDLGVLPEDIAEATAGAWEIAWNGLEEERQALIQDQRWRIERNSDELALGHTPTEDAVPVLKYVQAIRDLPEACPDPFNIVWPTVPPLP